MDESGGPEGRAECPGEFGDRPVAILGPRGGGALQDEADGIRNVDERPVDVCLGVGGIEGGRLGGHRAGEQGVPSSCSGAM